VASYFNLGTDQTPRWINLENAPVMSARRTNLPGTSEVHLRGGAGQDERVFGEAADRLIAQLEADPELKKTLATSGWCAVKSPSDRGKDKS
jgi:hypothetical protein